MQPGSEVFFDNLFTSFPLLEELSLRQTAGTGTVRQNRLNKIPIKSKKELEARAVPRGTMDVVYKEDVVLVGWKDSKAVYMASNKYGAEVKKTCKRFNRQEKKEVQVPMPEMFDHYNKEMGGVDYLDNMVAVYRVPFRVKKWWSPFYTWSLSVSAVNAWRLRMRITEQKEPFLDFLRELVMEMVTTHGHPPLKRGPSIGIGSAGQAADSLRFDGLNHWIGEQDGRNRRNCKLCYSLLKKEMKTPYICKKCSVSLHVTCFEGIVQYNMLLMGRIQNNFCKNCSESGPLFLFWFPKRNYFPIFQKLIWIRPPFLPL